MNSIDSKPFDRSELKACAICGKGVMHTGAPTFYEIAVTQCVADLKSIQQQHGLEVMLGGNAGLAAAFAPSTRVAWRMPSQCHLVCADCAVRPEPLLRFLEGSVE